MKIFYILIVGATTVSLAVADLTDKWTQIEIQIAKGFGKIQVSIPEQWEIQRFDVGFEHLRDTCYRIGPSETLTEDFSPKTDEEWPPSILLQFERTFRNAEPEGTEHMSLFSGPEKGVTKGGLSFVKWTTKGANVSVTNGTTDLDGFYTYYHFSGLPYQLAATAKFNKWQEDETAEQLEAIVESIAVISEKANTGRQATSTPSPAP